MQKRKQKPVCVEENFTDLAWNNGREDITPVDIITVSGMGTVESIPNTFEEKNRFKQENIDD